MADLSLIAITCRIFGIFLNHGNVVRGQQPFFDPPRHIIGNRVANQAFLISPPVTPRQPQVRGLAPLRKQISHRTGCIAKRHQMMGVANIHFSCETPFQF